MAQQNDEEKNAEGSVRVAASLEGSNDSWLVEVPASVTVSELRRRLAQQQGRSDVEEMTLTVEDQQAPASAGTMISELFRGARRGRVHLHRCKDVAVTVEYNTKPHSRAFPPSTTVHRVFVWAISKAAFNLETEAHDLELQLSGGTTALQPNTHIGTLTTNCRVKLELIPKDRPQG